MKPVEIPVPKLSNSSVAIYPKKLVVMDHYVLGLSNYYVWFDDLKNKIFGSYRLSLPPLGVKPNVLLAKLVQTVVPRPPQPFSSKQILSQLSKSRDVYGSIVLQNHLAMQVEKEAGIPVPRVNWFNVQGRFVWVGGIVWFGIDQRNRYYLLSYDVQMSADDFKPLYTFYIKHFVKKEI
jgi:hypothetical protein